MKRQSHTNAIRSLVAVGAVALLLGAPAVTRAAIAFQGVSKPVIFIPPVNPKVPAITFASGSAPFLTNLVNTCPHCIIPWRIRDPGVPFFPVPNGIPLIRDNTLANTPVYAAARAWGIWDPPHTEIVGDEIIRTFEVFTGFDASAPALNVIDLNDSRAQLISVSGYPNLGTADFPTQISISKPTGLEPLLDIISNKFIGLTTGTVYSTTLVESSFATLDADIEALAPGTTNPYDSYFAGATGRVVISYADVPMKDVIGYAEPIPEPSAWVLMGAGLAGLFVAKRRATRM